MKLSKQTQSFRKFTTMLWTLNDNIKKGKYFVEWIGEKSDFPWSIIEFDRLGYPIKNIGAREHINGKLTLYLNEDWKERLVFLNDEVKINGLFLSEFEDPGFYESLPVEIFISSPSSYLDPSVLSVL